MSPTDFRPDARENWRADYLVDRRRLRRRLTWWRFAAFVALAIALLAGAGRWYATRGTFGAQIARVSIEGLVTGDADTLKLLKDIETAGAVRALVVSIGSPGGTTTGAERLYDALRKVAAKKPVVAEVGTLAASGAYIAALGTDRIFAHGNSLVGSIGVLVQYPNFAGLLDKVGVQVEEVKSSPLKAAPNGFEPTSPEARAALASVVADSYVWFKNLVKDRRALSDAELAAVSDGRIFTARQGLPLKLVDQIGEESDAVAWLETERGVAKNLPIRDWTKPRSLERLGLFGLASGAARMVGADGAADALGRLAETAQAGNLDGLLAIWQGSTFH